MNVWHDRVDWEVLAVFVRVLDLSEVEVARLAAELAREARGTDLERHLVLAYSGIVGRLFRDAFVRRLLDDPWAGAHYCAASPPTAERIRVRSRQCAEAGLGIGGLEAAGDLLGRLAQSGPEAFEIPTLALLAARLTPSDAARIQLAIACVLHAECGLATEVLRRILASRPARRTAFCAWSNLALAHAVSEEPAAAADAYRRAYELADDVQLEAVPCLQSLVQSARRTGDAGLADWGRERLGRLAGERAPLRPVGVGVAFAPR